MVSTFLERIWDSIPTMKPSFIYASWGSGGTGWFVICYKYGEQDITGIAEKTKDGTLQTFIRRSGAWTVS